MNRKHDEQQRQIAEDEHEARRADAIAEKTPKYPQVKVRLVGEDGNAFAILGKVLGAMRRAGLTLEQRTEYQMEAMAGNYDHLLATTMKYVEVS